HAVLFTVYRTPVEDGPVDDGDIAVLFLKTGERKTVHRGGFISRYLPSGHLVYQRQNTLWAAPFDLRRLALTGAPQPMLVEGNGNDFNGGDFDVSTNGTLAYVSSRAELSCPFSIWCMDSAGRTTTLQVTPG